MDLLDQEASEEEHMLQQHPEMLCTIETSTSANQQYVDQSEQFRAALKQARRSDEEVRMKWDQWAPLINVLAGGEVGQRWCVWSRDRSTDPARSPSQEALMKQIPTSGRATEADAELPAAARALQTILEDLDDARTHRARLVNEGKRVASKDDVRSQVLEQAAKTSHGSSGEVKPEWFEDIFEKELRKYHRLVDEMRAHCDQQERVLGTLGVSRQVMWWRLSLLTSLQQP
jgi:programmed cell death 6-interacting protein